MCSRWELYNRELQSINIVPESDSIGQGVPIYKLGLVV